MSMPPKQKTAALQAAMTNPKQQAKAKELPEEEEPDMPWADSFAKGLLVEDLINEVIPLENDGTITDRQVHEQRPECSACHWTKFTARLASLRKQLSTRWTRTDVDSLALQVFSETHEKHEFNARGEPQWGGSETEKHLKFDIDHNKLDGMTRRQLCEDQDECQEFPWNVFCGHATQEMRLRKHMFQLGEKKKEKEQMRKETHVKQKVRAQKQKAQPDDSSEGKQDRQCRINLSNCCSAACCCC